MAQLFFSVIVCAIVFVTFMYIAPWDPIHVNFMMIMCYNVLNRTTDYLTQGRHSTGIFQVSRLLQAACGRRCYEVRSQSAALKLTIINQCPQAAFNCTSQLLESTKPAATAAATAAAKITASN
jgi:hypothetical protein